MKAFRFSLNRVLDWRQTELTTEEAKLENLRAEQRAARTDLEDLPRLRAEAQAKVSGTPVLQGRDLAGLESFHQWDSVGRAPSHNPHRTTPAGH